MNWCCTIVQLHVPEGPRHNQVTVNCHSYQMVGNFSNYGTVTQLLPNPETYIHAGGPIQVVETVRKRQWVKENRSSRRRGEGGGRRAREDEGE